jgi:hypothetical protein
VRTILALRCPTQRTAGASDCLSGVTVSAACERHTNHLELRPLLLWARHISVPGRNADACTNAACSTLRVTVAADYRVVPSHGSPY